MLASPASLSLLSFAAGAVVTALPLLFRLNAVKRRLATEKRMFSDLSTAWVQENNRAHLAEAKLAAIHNQHVQAGKLSHRADKERQAARTRELRQCIAARASNPLDRGLCYTPEVLTAREAPYPPAPLSSSCAGSAAAKMAGSRTVVSDMPTGSGRGQLPRRKRRPHSGASAAEAASENRAVESIPADFTQGASQ